MVAGDGARVVRHTRLARWLHGLGAAALLTLLVTGFALADVLPAGLVAALGGHARMDAVHTELGLVSVAAALLVMGLRARGALALAGELMRLRGRDAAWSLKFLAHVLLGRAAPPEHGGRLDPLQRGVLLVLLVSVAVAALSGVYLEVLPPAPRWVFIGMIRAHVYVEWVLLVALALHVLAGLGVLPTHRGIAASMFGDGAVPVETARRLWPVWARSAARLPGRVKTRGRS